MYRSVFVFVLLALLSSTIAEPHEEQLLAAGQKCVTEFANASHPPPPEGSFEDQRKCFLACVMKTLGMLQEGGTLIVDKAISYIRSDITEREKAIAALNACSDKKGANDCDTAYKIATCIRDQKVPLPETQQNH